MAVFVLPFFFCDNFRVLQRQRMGKNSPLDEGADWYCQQSLEKEVKKRKIYRRTKTRRTKERRKNHSRYMGAEYLSLMEYQRNCILCLPTQFIAVLNICQHKMWWDACDFWGYRCISCE